jgi:hypothetical protein
LRLFYKFVQAPFVTPRRQARGLLMKRHPERSEGCLGTGVPRENMVELSLRAYFFVAPREERGPPARGRPGGAGRPHAPPARGGRVARGRGGGVIACGPGGGGREGGGGGGGGGGRGVGRGPGGGGARAACAPGEDSRGRRPERSEGCLAIARHDGGNEK